MTDPITNPTALFRGAFPEPLLRQITRVVAEAYSSRSAYRLFPPPEMMDLWPDIRRAKIEADLRHIVDGFEGVSARPETNTRNNSHTIVERGEVAFTQSHVNKPTEVVRPAVHREQKARSNRAYFPCMAQEMEPLPTSDASVYAILIHGESPGDTNTLGFLDVVFPSPDGRSYLDNRIHLISLLRTASAADTSEEQIDDDLDFGLRDRDNEEGA